MYWYKKIWSLDIKDSTWVEDTENQVDFIVKTLGLLGNERILDLACGYGRHSISLARRGYSIVGVDITKDYIDDAVKTANKNELVAEFIHSDIRDLKFDNEFDVVLNLADGAIGYLENEDENLKIFDVIAKSLKPGGKHFMDVCNAEHAELYFPKRHWQIGEKEIALADFEWIPETRRMLYGGGGIKLGEILQKPDISPTNPTRLYSKSELSVILEKRGMEIVSSFSDYYGTPDSNKKIQIMVYSSILEN
ncbi:MAG: class I SAM-dependent methyltransferase [Treponema sp.]|jgi:2-polyprenyl-3-methyl-5-hydroxy-6-metoxy-1,4-benzoquinol methylase|nr:class I SAM-dependent methyltransferase [Treponema sp.]